VTKQISLYFQEYQCNAMKILLAHIERFSISSVQFRSFSSPASHTFSIARLQYKYFARSMTSSTPVRLAILDDNLSLSPPHFAQLPPARIAITAIPNAASLPEDQLVAALMPFEAISTMRERTRFPATLINQLPNLKLLLVTGMRHNCFDVDACKARGIKVAAAPGHNKSTGAVIGGSQGGSHPTTQHTWALILGLARGVAREHEAMVRGEWQVDVAIGTTGRTLGVVGLGRLGASVARIAVIAFGMRVVCWSSSLTQEKADTVVKELGLPIENERGEKTFKVVSKDELFSTADIITLHYTLGARSIGIVGAKELALMKKSALFINTSRGPLVDEKALLDTMEKGGIRGVALDVFNVEPLQKNHPFRTNKWGREGRSELLLAPHMGYVEKESLDIFYAETAENIERWLDGKDFNHQLA
jgi:phosphoglycerate dehydrogenase-like enzyme